MHLRIILAFLLLFPSSSVAFDILNSPDDGSGDISINQAGCFGPSGFILCQSNPLTFSASFLTSLVPEVAKGSSTPTFTRSEAGSSNATTTSFTANGYTMVYMKPNEARFYGARRVENLVLSNSENISGASYSVTGASKIDGHTVQFNAQNGNLYQTITVRATRV